MEMYILSIFVAESTALVMLGQFVVFG